jgi:hypothetical protein
MEPGRRNFLRVVPGLAFGLTNGVVAVAQTSTGELRTASGILHLEGRLKSGVLTIDAQDFMDRTDRSVIVRGRLDSVELYSAMFSYRKDLTVFALFQDSGHSTTVVLSDSEDAKIGRLVVWSDSDSPQIHNIDKNKIMAIDDPKDIVDVNGKHPDLVGNRKQAAFTWQELEKVFGSDPALAEFMRGRKSHHHPSEENKLLEWACRFLSMVPGSLLSLVWLA